MCPELKQSTFPIRIPLENIVKDTIQKKSKEECKVKKREKNRKTLSTIRYVAPHPNDASESLNIKFEYKLQPCAI